MTEVAIQRTPGPWEIVPTVHSYRKHIFHRDPTNAYYIGTLIAGSPKDLAIFRANFQLIGTAPELLEALELIIKWAELHGLDKAPLISGQSGEVPVIAKARSAIAKVRGQS
jgi:hypothetical protein